MSIESRIKQVNKTIEISSGPYSQSVIKAERTWQVLEKSKRQQTAGQRRQARDETLGRTRDRDRERAVKNHQPSEPRGADVDYTNLEVLYRGRLNMSLSAIDWRREAGSSIESELDKIGSYVPFLSKSLLGEYYPKIYELLEPDEEILTYEPLFEAAS